MASVEPTAPPPSSFSNPPANEPWRFGPEPVYATNASSHQALQGLAAPDHSGGLQQHWHEHRKRVLKEWGAKREAEMHRPPLWCMDQLCSGSGLFPPRHLGEDWFSPEELRMIASLEGLLQPTGHASVLARDIMALRIYDVDVAVIADDSGSMRGSMIGGYGATRGRAQQGYYGNSGWTSDQVQKVFGQRAFRPADLEVFSDNPFPPTTMRWEMLTDALAKWDEVFSILQLQRKVYLLNSQVDPSGPLRNILDRGPCGGTPLGGTFARVLADYRQGGQRLGRPLLILALTDGEASDQVAFNAILDEIQDGLHGDVQVCLMGLSLEPEDIAWFEDEECDDTRIRTIEAWEVEQQMILYRKVIPRSSCYNFAMHTYRALVTNFFPADYDYDAPLQTLRHRLYITLHAIDRRVTGNRDADYSMMASWDFSTVSLLSCAGLDGCFAGVTRGKYDAGFTQDDDQAIGGFLGGLQQRLLEGRTSRFVQGSVNGWTSGYGGGYGGYGGGYGDGCGYGGGYNGDAGYGQGLQRWRISREQLRRLQCAIGDLSPSETQMRDLQFRNPARNDRALELALGHLRKAAKAS